MKRMWLGVVGLPVLLAMAPYCGGGIEPVGQDQNAATELQGELVRTRCDTEEFRYFADTVVLHYRAAQESRGSLFDPGSVMVSAREANNSQVHDCQRLISRQDGVDRPVLRYGPLVGLLISPERVQLPVPREGRIVAEIVNHDEESYGPLGIPKGLSCLWIRHDADATPAWLAAIVPPGASGCASTTVEDLPSMTLMVNAIPVEDGTPSEDLPHTGRWMWDSGGAQQFIGIQCGDAWCEIGPDGFNGTRRIVSVDSVPGWYDEQLLAIPGDQLMVSGLTGLIVPGEDNRIAESPQIQNVRPRGKYGLHVATLYFRGRDTATWSRYAEKFALPMREFASGHPVFMNPADTTVPGPEDPNPLRRFRTPNSPWTGVRRCDVTHSGSGTVRWAWSEDDEGFWVPCAEGCCMVRGMGGT